MEEQKQDNKSYHFLYIALIALLVSGLIFTSLKLKKLILQNILLSLNLDTIS